MTVPLDYPEITKIYNEQIFPWVVQKLQPANQADVLQPLLPEVSGPQWKMTCGPMQSFPARTEKPAVDYFDITIGDGYGITGVFRHSRDANTGAFKPAYSVISLTPPHAVAAFLDSVKCVQQYCYRNPA